MAKRITPPKNVVATNTDAHPSGVSAPNSHRKKK
jgi:hypothetical protein